MYRYQLYDSDEIDKLTRKLANYKDTLDILMASEKKDKTGNNKFYETELLKVKGEMKEMEDKYQKKIAEYELEEQYLSSQIKTINNSLNKLRYDVNRILDTVEQMRFTDLHEKMNQIISKQDMKFLEEISEVSRIKEELFRLNEQIDKENTTREQPQPPRQSEYRRLQNMLDSSTYVEQTSNFKQNNQPLRPHPGSSQRSFPKNTAVNAQDTLSMGRGKKVFYNSQYELNKNIITKSNSANNKQTKKKIKNHPDENTEMVADNHTPALADNHSLAEKPGNDIPAKEKPSETNLANKASTDANNPSPKKVNSAVSNRRQEKRPTDTELQIEWEDKSKDNQKQEGKMTELASLFSIFRRG